MMMMMMVTMTIMMMVVVVVMIYGHDNGDGDVDDDDHDNLIMVSTKSNFLCHIIRLRRDIGSRSALISLWTAGQHIERSNLFLDMTDQSSSH